MSANKTLGLAEGKAAIAAVSTMKAHRIRRGKKNTRSTTENAVFRQ